MTPTHVSRRWLDESPDDVLVPVGAIRGVLAGLPSAVEKSPRAPVTEPSSLWVERLWTAPAETRIGVQELAEALGRSVSWVHKRTSEKAARQTPAASRLPHRKLDGALVFVVGEIRTWLEDHEEIEHAGTIDHRLTLAK